MRVTIVGVCGGSGAGKTTLTRRLVEQLGPDRVAVLGFDSYYHDLAHLPPEDRAATNFDHPASLDGDLFVRHIDELRAGRPVPVPVYDFAVHSRTGTHELLEPRPYVVLDGILLFAFPDVCTRLDLAVYVDAPAPLRLNRRMARDVIERGRDPESVRWQFETTVAPMHDTYVEPFKHLAHRVVHHDEDRDAVVAELLGHLEPPAVAPAHLDLTAAEGVALGMTAGR